MIFSTSARFNNFTAQEKLDMAKSPAKLNKNKSKVKTKICRNVLKTQTSISKLKPRQPEDGAKEQLKVREAIYYHGPHILCNFVGETQNKFLFSIGWEG